MQQPSLKAAIARAQQQRDYTALIDAIPYAKYLGIKMQQQDDALQFLLKFKPQLIGNPMLPAIHGGVVAGFLEHSAILHTIIAQQSATMPKLFNFSIDYLRPAAASCLHAKCELVRQGRRVWFMRIKAWQEDSAKPVALARAYLILQ